MNVEIGNEAAQFPEKEYVNGIFVAVWALNLWHHYIKLENMDGLNDSLPKISLCSSLLFMGRRFEPHLGRNAKISAAECNIKGTVSRDFRLLVFFMNLFPQAPEYTIRAISNFSKIRRDIHSSRCTTGVIDTGGKWKKSSIIKVLIICLDTFGK